MVVLPGKVDGIPKTFEWHPFRFLDHKEQVAIKKHVATQTGPRVIGKGCRFYMDFGFLRTLASDFGQPRVETDRVVTLFDGFELYLLIVYEITRHVWVFLTQLKDPPVETTGLFLMRYGHKDGGMILCDQGGELARSEEGTDRRR